MVDDQLIDALKQELEKKVDRCDCGTNFISDVGNAIVEWTSIKLG